MNELLKTLINGIKLLIPKFTLDEALEIGMELGMTQPLTDESGYIFTDENGDIYSFK